MLIGKSLHESGDAQIVDIHGWNEETLIAQIARRFSVEERAHFRYYQDAIKFNFRSSLARTRHNGKVIDELVWEGQDLVTDIEIYSFDPKNLPGKKFSANRFLEGTEVGKFYAPKPENLVPNDIVREYITQRGIIIGEGGSLDGDSLRIGPNNGTLIPIQKKIIEPNYKFNEDILQQVIQRLKSRSRLRSYENEIDVDELIIPPHGGLVSIATLGTCIEREGNFQGLEVLVLDPDIPGVHHTEARVLSQYKKLRFDVEFENTTNEPVEIQDVEVLFYYPTEREFKLYVPQSFEIKSATEIGNSSKVSSLIDKFDLPSDNQSTIEYIAVSHRHPQGIHDKISRDDIGAQKQLYLDFVDDSDVSFIFNQFPGTVGAEPRGDIMDRLLNLAKEGILRSAYLLTAPEGNFFSLESIQELSKLENANVQTYWKNINMDNIWMPYNSSFWVPHENLKKFETYKKSGKWGSIYGSSQEVTKDDKIYLDGLMKGAYKFHGGHLAIITGGNGTPGSTMEYINDFTRENNIMNLGVFWGVDGQPPIGKFDAVQYYEERELLDRQKVMGEDAEFEAYAPKWGIGTLLEFAFGGTMLKVDIGIKPVLFLGNEYENLHFTLNEQKEKGLIDARVVDLLKNPITVPKNITDKVDYVTNLVYNKFCTEYNAAP